MTLLRLRRAVYLRVRDGTGGERASRRNTLNSS